MAPHITSRLSCPDSNCTRIFTTQVGLKRHWQRVHRDSLKERSHVCDLCHRSFTSLASLVNHRSVCLGDEGCFPRCGCQFSKGNRARHLRFLCLLDLFEDRELSVKNFIEQCYVRVWLDISVQISANPFRLSITSLMIP